jgi:hypothetical protein
MVAPPGKAVCKRKNHPDTARDSEIWAKERDVHRPVNLQTIFRYEQSVRRSQDDLKVVGDIAVSATRSGTVKAFSPA